MKKKELIIIGYSGHSYGCIEVAIKQGIKIGNNVIVGAGAVVLKNINSNTTFVGNPAKEI